MAPPMTAPMPVNSSRTMPEPQVRLPSLEVDAGRGAARHDHADQRDADGLAERQPEPDGQQRDDQQPAAEPQQRPERPGGDPADQQEQPDLHRAPGGRAPVQARAQPRRAQGGAEDASERTTRCVSDRAQRQRTRMRRISRRYGRRCCGRVRKERDVAGALEGDRELALVAGAGAGLAARLDLGALREVAAEAVDLLVVDLDRLVGAEGADLPAPAVAVEVVALARACWQVACRSVVSWRSVVERSG